MGIYVRIKGAKQREHSAREQKNGTIKYAKKYKKQKPAWRKDKLGEYEENIPISVEGAAAMGRYEKKTHLVKP